LLCKFFLSFFFLDSEWHDFPLPFNCSFGEREVRCIELSIYVRVGSVIPCPDFHPDFVGSVPVGGEFSLFRILLVSQEDEVAHFEFYLYDFLVMASSAASR
jgi:hypothetical protein